MPFYLLPYDALLAEAAASAVPAPQYLRERLPDLFFDAYLSMTPRPANVMAFTHGTFEDLYDHYAELEATGAVDPDDISESRLVAAIGFSRPNVVQRSHDDGRLRGWLGPTGETFGSKWDKGHFVAHSIGGAVDGLEANVFLQLRGLNRGAYRVMERYCASNPGVLCFSRPLYGDPSACPAQIEFGVLKATGDLWVNVFDNWGGAPPMRQAPRGESGEPNPK